ncbi:MAG: DUF3267 domain-containing protein [Acetatifactor sp.]|nr:DUF3267 domain-containing protein [Acetatifactor sp.]
MKKEKEKQMLTETEKKRLERFEKLAMEMEQRGYTRRNLTIDMGKANLFAGLLLIPLAIIGGVMNYLVNDKVEIFDVNIWAFLVAFLVLIVVHELIHGACWSIFSPHHFKDIEFGIMKPWMSPYCTCLEPLTKKAYIFGCVMPFVVLGVLFMILGVVINDSTVLMLGVMMADAAAGDIMVIQKILAYKSNADEITYMDHPTEAGGVIFER